MCQAFAGEQRFYEACQSGARRRGYEAFQAGLLRTDIPDDLWFILREDWELGFDIAERGAKLF